MRNHDDKYPSPPGFEPDTPRLQAPVDTYGASGPPSSFVERTPGANDYFPSPSTYLTHGYVLNIYGCTLLRGSFWLMIY